MEISVVAGPAPRDASEVVERKGVGHPDTICDALAEELSVALSHFYLERYGTILHHNVDKALLRGGSARARFGGGEVVEPIDIYLAGRAVTKVGNDEIPVESLAVECSRQWLREHLHALEPERHVRLHCFVRSGSQDLTDLFGRGRSSVSLANDTSFGVGVAPRTRLEETVLAVDARLNASEALAERPAWGEDLKIMGCSRAGRTTLTIGRAFVARHVASLDEYLEEKRSVANLAEAVAQEQGIEADVAVNAGDNPDAGSVYITVTGTSGEAGDDGQVGRGNRVTGLITPGRPMSLEAAAGKNPVSHIGKLYNLAAQRIAEAVVSEIAGVRRAECLLLSSIGSRIDQPGLAEVSVETGDRPLSDVERAVREVAGDHIARVPKLYTEIIERALKIY